MTEGLWSLIFTSFIVNQHLTLIQWNWFLPAAHPWHVCPDHYDLFMCFIPRKASYFSFLIPGPYFFKVGFHHFFFDCGQLKRSPFLNTHDTRCGAPHILPWIDPFEVRIFCLLQLNCPLSGYIDCFFFSIWSYFNNYHSAGVSRKGRNKGKVPYKEKWWHLKSSRRVGRWLCHLLSARSSASHLTSLFSHWLNEHNNDIDFTLIVRITSKHLCICQVFI